MFARWLLPKAVKKGKTIKSFHPHTKFKNQKTVADVKLDAGLKKLKDVSEDYKDTIRKFGKTVDKATKTLKKQEGNKRGKKTCFEALQFFPGVSRTVRSFSAIACSILRVFKTNSFFGFYDSRIYRFFGMLAFVGFLNFW